MGFAHSTGSRPYKMPTWGLPWTSKELPRAPGEPQLQLLSQQGIPLGAQGLSREPLWLFWDSLRAPLGLPGFPWSSPRAPQEPPKASWEPPKASLEHPKGSPTAFLSLQASSLKPQGSSLKPEARSPSPLNSSSNSNSNSNSNSIPTSPSGRVAALPPHAKRPRRDARGVNNLRAQWPSPMA